MKTTTLFALLLSPFTLLHAQSFDSTWVNSVDDRAYTAYRAGDHQGTILIYAKALDSARTRYGAESEEAIIMLGYMADIQKVTGDFERAEQSFMTLLEICKRKYSAPHEQIAKALGQLGHTRFKLGQLETAVSLMTEAQQMFEDLGMHYTHQLAHNITLLAGVYQAQGFYLKAEQLHLEAVDIEKNIPKFDEGIYGAVINNLASFYAGLQQSGEALRYYDISLRLKEKQLGKTHAFYLLTLRNKGTILADAGRYSEAEIILKEALNTAKENFAPDDPQLSAYIRALAALYAKTGNYELAIQLEKESRRLLKNRFGDTYPDYITGLINEAALHRACSRLTTADTLLHEALQLLEREKRTQTASYTAALMQLGKVCQASKKYGQARALLEKSARLGGAILGDEHPAYHELYGEALVQQDLLENRPDSALHRLNAMRDPILTAYGDRHLRYISLESQYGAAWQLKGNAAEALQHFRAAFAAMQHNMARNFSFLSNSEREKFAALFEEYRNAFLATARSFPNDNHIRTFLYDLVLFQKELLASYDRQLLADWQQQADSTFKAYVEVRQMIARQWTLPAKQRLDLPELEARQTELEKSLALKSGLASDLNVFQKVEWQQVQAALQPGDAAVEWLSLPSSQEGREKSACYAALILRPGYTAPELVLLPDVASVAALFASKGNRGLQYATRTYTGDALYQMLWRPLESRLNGVQRIFYAPTGALHLLNFDAIQTATNGQLLCEKYRLVRVTNTARLLDSGFGQQLSGIRSALLAGGLNYESAVAETTVETTPQAAENGILWRGGSAVREWAALPNTLPEVEHLTALLQEKKVQTSLLTGSNGSETAVKANCVAAAPGILHFATHGFFFEKNTATTGSLGLAAAENPMFRSGLILSGANPVWRGEAASDTRDDGILTADEISLLPLRHTALVVLSACETGLGDVHDDEGVYGLQRAFRLAGVQNIVMSLWRVPDVQTRQFMENLYAALLEQGDIRGAFQNARQAMRKKYTNPYYWAGFVLLE